MISGTWKKCTKIRRKYEKMKTQIYEYYNELQVPLRLSPEFKLLLMQTCEDFLPTEKVGKKVNKVLEILLCTHQGDFLVKKIFKTMRVKDFSFQLWFPIEFVKANENNFLPIFTTAFFAKLPTILEEAKINYTQDKLNEAQNGIIKALEEDKEKFAYKENILDQIVF